MSHVTDSKPSKPPTKRALDAARIVDMRRRGMKEDEIATIMGVKKAAISRRLERAGARSKQLAAFREDKSLILEEKQKLLLDALTEEKVSTMSGKDLTISAAVLIDKQRLLDGHSASGGNISLLVIANKVHAQYQSTKGDDRHVIEAEVVSPEPETVVDEVNHGEA